MQPFPSLGDLGEINITMGRNDRSKPGEFAPRFHKKNFGSSLKGSGKNCGSSLKGSGKQLDLDVKHAV